MVKIRNIIKTNDLNEACKIFTDKKSARIIGGGAFLRLGSANILNAIDLECLDLQFINDNDEYIEIGAMTTLRDLETSEIIKNNFSGILSKCVENIVGVQLRNIATVGGTVAGRYGFSDVLTALLALDTKVCLHDSGEIPLEEFLKLKKIPRDIITKIIIKKDNADASFMMMRNSASDYAIINCAVSRVGDTYKMVVGASPAVASIAYFATEVLNNTNNIDEAIKLDNLRKDIKFGDNLRASHIYRENIIGALLKRAFMEVGK